MRLTQWTDYSLRVLMYCAATESRPTPPTISEIAQALAMTENNVNVTLHRARRRLEAQLGDATMETTP